ncbi:hypothetical protein CK203_099946 [Vitis vinifera]|uniref:Uncharacterized protein n=1 Tax=Vitis vinifera TaxID=29760 RepID=A0A438CYJ5_VITVI|nr:hypothetical protein CK203_099946 [Vitis vinifera]
MHVMAIIGSGRVIQFLGTPEGDSVHPAECMQQLLEKVRRHKVNIDGNVCTVMVTTLVLEHMEEANSSALGIYKEKPRK